MTIDLPNFKADELFNYLRSNLRQAYVKENQLFIVFVKLFESTSLLEK